MSSIVRSIHLSIQQNSWRWKLVNILFSCFKKIKKNQIIGLHIAKYWWSDCSCSIWKVIISRCMLFHIATGSGPSHSWIQFKAISFLTWFNMEKMNKFHYQKKVSRKFSNSCYLKMLKNLSKICSSAKIAPDRKNITSQQLEHLTWSVQKSTTELLQVLCLLLIKTKNGQFLKPERSKKGVLLTPKMACLQFVPNWHPSNTWHAISKVQKHWEYKYSS